MNGVEIKPEDLHVPGWHGIDTAPKDGVEIEVLNNRWWSRGYRKTSTVYWRQFLEPKHTAGHTFGVGFWSHTQVGEWVPLDGDRERWSWTHWRPKTLTDDSP